ncbi:hypothetical protein VUR80DRAFT_3966 [Thermomyces stellatus]
MSQRRLCKGDWVRHKDLIRDRFVLEEVSLEDCVRELQGSGLNVTPKQLEYRLRKWGFRRNISAAGWRYIDHQIQKRSQRGDESQVLLHGKPVKDGTSLQIAAELGSLPITRLLDHGADVNAPGDPKRGPTLVRAAVFSRIDVIQMLLNEGAGITGRDRESYRGAVKAAFLKELVGFRFGWL